MSGDTTDPNRLLRVSEAADVLGISVRSVWRLIHDEKLRVRKIRGATRIKRKDVDDFSDES